MKKNLVHKITCLVLSLSLLSGSFSILSNAKTISASSIADSNVSLSNIDTISRVYDSSRRDILQYHYEDQNGKRINISDSTNKSTQSNLTSKRAVALPETYDLRGQNVITSIKDQGITGCCWAFAAIKSLESNLISKGLTSVDNTDLSESHLVWHTLNTSSQKTDALYGEGISHSYSTNRSSYLLGGSALISAFTLARWSGAVYEATAPFSGNTISQLDTMANTMAAKSASIRYRKNFILTDASCYDAATTEQIKEAIMTNGALDVSYYYDKAYDTTTENNEICYYQTKYSGEDAINNANHSVTIIGWDDTYPKENFGKNAPNSDGAWLIANSYGTSYGKNGYFWLSYKEPSLTEFFSLTGDKAAAYDNNYQYDATGWGSGIVSSNSSSITGANIYTANNNYTQLLKAVGIYTITDEQPYTIKIYRNVTAGKPTSGTLAATLSGTQEFQGYHTISLPNGIPLKAGEKFSVVITYNRTHSKNGYLPIEGADSTLGALRLNYTSNAGESFLYTNLKKDGSTSNWDWYDIKTYGNDKIQNNICIKAFTTNQQSAGSLSLSKSSIKLGKGERFKVTATAKNVTNKTVTYTSANNSIATVSNTGNITAKGIGKTKITATLSTGRTASIVVTVKKAPKKITLKHSKKKTIRRKKSFTIKVKLPSGSASNKITFTSSKPKVAKVSSKGKVTGKKKGTTVITVKTYNKKKAKIKVYVK